MQKEPLSPHDLLHRLWTKAVGTPEYIKAEWRAMERLIRSLDERDALLMEVLRTRSSLPVEIIDKIKNRSSLDPRAFEELP